MTKKKHIENRKTNTLKTVIFLYLFLIVIPFFIIDLGGYTITCKPIIVSTISFFYSLLSFLIAILTYKNLNKLKDKDFEIRNSSLKKGLLVIFIYFFTSEFEAIPLLLLTKDINTLPLFVKTIYLSIYEILQISLIIFILKDEIKKCIKDIKKNHKQYFASCGKYYLFAIIIMMCSNLIISFINSGNIAGNEQAVRNALKTAPLYMYFSAVIIAPILEELTFRQGIRNIFSNNKTFIITSGLVFGGLHLLGNINSAIDLLYLIPYSVPGFAFAYMLTKTDNVLVPIGFHFLHNGITMSLQILLMFLGA